MRFLHTMLRVGDLQRSIDFYTRAMGMTLLRTTERPEQGYSLAFVGYGANPEQAEIELTYNHGVSSYELGTAFGHIALGMPDVARPARQIRQAGGTVTREPGPVKGGTTIIAFVADPDGYKIELIEREPAQRTRSAALPSRAGDPRPVPTGERIGWRQPRAADDLDVGERQVVGRRLAAVMPPVGQKAMSANGTGPRLQHRDAAGRAGRKEFQEAASPSSAARITSLAGRDAGQQREPQHRDKPPRRSAASPG